MKHAEELAAVPILQPENAEGSAPTGQTLREILGVAEQGPELRQTRGSGENKGCDCIPSQGIPYDAPEAAPSQRPDTPPRQKRISRLQLMALREKLSARELQILGTLQEYHFVSSQQIQRLYFTDGSSAPANSRAANRALKRLGEYGVIAHLDRRIGGWKAGSAAQVWHLTEPGERLLRLNAAEKLPRKRPEEPSPQFLDHTLAVTECAVALICQHRDEAEHAPNQHRIEPERKIEKIVPYPAYTFSYGGKTSTLKPDLYVVIQGPDYHDHYFLEMVRSLDPLSKLLRKAQAHLNAYKSNELYRQLKIQPYVVWVMPDKREMEAFTAAILEEMPEARRFFRIILAEQLAESPGLLAAEELCLECPKGPSKTKRRTN